MTPTQTLLHLRQIAEQPIDLSRPDNGDEDVAAVRVEALFVDTPATPLDPVADLGEGELDELAHGVSLAGRQHIIIRLFLLQDQLGSTTSPSTKSRA